MKNSLWPNKWPRTFFKVDLDLHTMKEMILDLISFALIFCGYLFFKAYASRENDDGSTISFCSSKSKVQTTKSAVKTSPNIFKTVCYRAINCLNCTWWST